MQDSMQPLFTGERAMHFLRETVVGSMEGMLFALLSALFTLAGAAIFLEDSFSSGGTSEMTASAAAEPAAPAFAGASAAQAATIQQASYVISAK